MQTETAEQLRQAYWEARAILGFDNDGDPTPAALSYPQMGDLMRRDAAEFRKDYDEACDEAAKLRAVMLRTRDCNSLRVIDEMIAKALGLTP